MSLKRIRSACVIIVGSLLFSLHGCAHYPVNEPKGAGHEAVRYQFHYPVEGLNTDSLFICLAFSGGGTRAAALSYGVLEKLRHVRITWKGVEKSLLDEVDCISSISGGSFTAAYYGLFGDRIFEEFRPKFLDVNVQSKLFGRLFNPVNWMRLASPYFSRIDLAAEYYDEHLFEGKTFAALAHPPRRPFVIVNATNMVNGERFEFTQEQLDFLASDLNSYPVARAVAASSAFPFLLSPITLKNYPHTDFRLPADYQGGLQDYDVNRRRYYWAKNRMIYLDDERYPYLHLMDGGLSDNIGLRPIEAAYRRTSGFIRRLINEGKIEKFVIIIVNARTVEKDTLSRSESPPGILTVAAKTATIAMENYSVETIETMKELRLERVKAQKNLAACQKRLDQCPGSTPLPTFATTIDPYVIEVNFEALRDPARRDYFQSLPTSFSLTSEQVDALIRVGPQLLEESPDYREFLESLAIP
ncbi:MAG: patatin-like phospholipase family protein [Nitrospira sp.]|nr:patatin-like phospholipase family protein [Nitrospira sp.]MCP9441758.1 patatin-like phospholipase family protein [Nitrospira sp.]